MRILYWSEQYWPYLGGLEIVASRFAASMAKRGHHIEVLTAMGSLDLPPREEHEGVTIHRFPFHRAIAAADVQSLLETQAAVKAHKRAFDPDLIHLAIVAPSVFFHLQTAEATTCPVLVTQQLSPSLRQSAASDTIYGRLLRSADWVTGCSRSVVEETRHLVPEVTGRSCTIYNGVAEPVADPGPLPTDPVLLCVGRLVPEKGFDLVVAALPAIRAAHPTVKLTIAGDGPARRDLEAQCRELGVEDAVTFAGWVVPEAIPELMNTASVVVVPSRTEAFGLVAVEAGLMARPVVATCVGGLPEVVDHGCTGLLVEPDQVGPLERAICELLAEPELMATLGRRARADGHRFTWDAHLDAYEAIYQRLVNGADDQRSIAAARAS